MSLRTSLFASLFCAVVLGCGGSTDTGGTATDTGAGGDTSSGGDTNGVDGKSDSSSNTDTSVGGDTTSGSDTTTSGDGGVTCGSTTCAPGEVCCAKPGDGGASFTCGSSCPDGSVPLRCTGGKDCGGGTPYCCGTITLSGSGLSCSFSAGEASCASACQTEIPLACSGTHKARLCDKIADCADDTGYPQCCMFSSGGTSGQICSNGTMASFATSCL